MKNFTQKVILTAWMTFACLPAVFAQSRSVTGQVRDAKTGEPLAGVSVVVANTTTGSGNRRTSTAQYIRVCGNTCTTKSSKNSA